ncbi:MAG: hypothetical protein ABSA16_14550 [Thermoguttaceae bacterium]|jgi:hypothetical protein
MTPEEIEELFRRKTAEWEQITDSAERWRLLQDFLTWADAQKPVPRNSKEGCLAAQRKLLERMK